MYLYLRSSHRHFFSPAVRAPWDKGGAPRGQWEEKTREFATYCVVGFQRRNRNPHHLLQVVYFNIERQIHNMLQARNQKRCLRGGVQAGQWAHHLSVHLNAVLSPNMQDLSTKHGRTPDASNKRNPWHLHAEAMTTCVTNAMDLSTKNGCIDLPAWPTPSIGATDCAPEIDASETTADFQWCFPMDCQLHFPTDVHFFSGISQRLVTSQEDLRWSLPMEVHSCELRCAILGDSKDTV